MKEEWLLHGAVVPVDVETTSALVAEIHRLIGVVGGMALAQPEQDVGITRYADISVGKIIHNSSPPQRTWLGLTGEEIEASKPTRSNDAVVWELAVEWAEAKLKEKNT